MAQDKINDAIHNTVADLISRIYEYGASRSKSQLDKFRLSYDLGLRRYREQTSLRCSRVKTLISRSEPVDIRTIYTLIDLSTDSQTLSEPQFHEILDAGGHCLIVGRAGCGKSIFMKNIFLRACAREQRIPIFIELRHVPLDSDVDMITYIVSTMSHFIGDITSDAIHYSLLRNRFVLILDGFDEIDPLLKPIAEEQILSIAHKYPTCPIVVSSRPDKRFQSWHSFHEYKIMPFSQDQLSTLISNIQYDADTKQRFIKAVGEGLYVSHKEFLSNPLLASMMLLTFDEFQDVPKKMHVFYGAAFEVLFQRHDATKPEFKRVYTTGLSIDEFERVFCTFCFISYIDKQYSFDRLTILTYLGMALDYDNVKKNAIDILGDLVENVCIIMNDGEDFVFLHRSFQEYFAAKFLSDRTVDDYATYIDSIHRQDHEMPVILLLSDINREVLDVRYTLEISRRVLEYIDNNRLHTKQLLLSFHSLAWASTNERRLTFATTLGEEQPRFHSYVAIASECFPDHSLYGGPDAEIDESIYSKILEDWMAVPRAIQGSGEADDRLDDDYVEIEISRIPESLFSLFDLDPYIDFLRAQATSIQDEILSRKSKKRDLLSTLLVRRKRERE